MKLSSPPRLDDTKVKVLARGLCGLGSETLRSYPLLSVRRVLRSTYMNSTQLSSPYCLEDANVWEHELYAAVLT